MVNAPHLLHFTKVGAVIFQFALRRSLLPLEDLFFGQIDMVTPPLTYMFQDRCKLPLILVIVRAQDSLATRDRIFFSPYADPVD